MPIPCSATAYGEYAGTLAIWILPYAALKSILLYPAQRIAMKRIPLLYSMSITSLSMVSFTNAHTASLPFAITAVSHVSLLS